MKHEVKFSIEQVDGADNDYFKTLQAGLRQYHQTQQISGPHDTAYFSLRVRGANDETLGGLYALMYWGWLRIELLWLHEDIRGRGIGSQLLRQAEAIAREHDCQYVYTQVWETALGFYLKRGYHRAGELVDYPPGHTYFTLRKELQ